MHVLRSLLATGAMLASVGLASAAEPTLLTEEQLDGVTAGLTVNTTAFYSLVTTPNNSVTTDFIIQTVTAPEASPVAAAPAAKKSGKKQK